MDRHLLDTGPGWLATADLPCDAAQQTTTAPIKAREALHLGKGRVATPNGRMQALRAAWVAHTVKQAIAAVGSASDEDYRAFGWDRGALLIKLQLLQGEIEQAGANRGTPLAVTVTRAGPPKRPAAETSTDSQL